MAKQMRAAYYQTFGGNDVIKTGNLEMPELKEGEVLVRVKAAGVNPVDVAVRAGHLQAFIPPVFPVVPGWDLAGVVEDRGFSARRFKVGDEVYAYARRPVLQWGTFAQYIVLPESYLALRPQTLSWEAAAGIPLVGLTAYQALFDAGHLQKGQTVLILGASGGVGTVAIQLAKSKGAEVVGVASEKNHSYMKKLGATHTIDYGKAPIGEAVNAIYPGGVDLILDAVSGESLQQSLPVLKKTGKLVSILNRGTDLDKSINFQYVFVEPNAAQLDALRQLADAGQLTMQVSKTYGLDGVAAAFQQIESHHTTGKIVIVP